MRICTRIAVLIATLAATAIVTSVGPADDGFVSEVDTAGRGVCAFRTRNADGTPIDTALVSDASG